ncbi:hypothetical protein TrRE_jg4200 [Triparma retinervis]|uniref:Uncharacterized protein n=1 Tax=Triparma retinervis TaxID=2557542 RepID=A0A9W6Z9I3_9STRA|nr:hypothetical protein TrRE_jg4200 [Triparma retinervis]
MMRSSFATLCLVIFASTNFASAQTLTCNVGGALALDGSVTSCTSSSLRYKDNKPFEGPSGTTCEGDQYACLTGNWAGSFDTAYGCFGGGSSSGVNQIENAKSKIIEGCKSSPTCLSNNPGGVPARGWTSCTESDCNPCQGGPLGGGAKGLSPSIAVGVGAALISAAFTAVQ